MRLKDRLMLRLLKTVIRMDGWVEVSPNDWRYGKNKSRFCTGDGSELIRLIMRRLRAGERNKERRIKNGK